MYDTPMKKLAEASMSVRLDRVANPGGSEPESRLDPTENSVNQGRRAIRGLSVPVN
jgi:hypothetical protein